jgi:hypothetical protein
VNKNGPKQCQSQGKEEGTKNDGGKDECRVNI